MYLPHGRWVPAWPPGPGRPVRPPARPARHRRGRAGPTGHQEDTIVQSARGEGAAARRTAALGWEAVRLAVEAAPTVNDDLEALANAVRGAARPQPAAEPVGQGVEVGRRGHLRVLRSAPPGRPGD